jgi:hypothetical protein
MGVSRVRAETRRTARLSVVAADAATGLRAGPAIHRTHQMEKAMSRNLKPALSLTALVLTAAALGGVPTTAAAAPGAKCPASTPTSRITPVYTNNILRCEQRAISNAVCPPTHLNYDIQSGADVCRTVNVAVPPPGPLTATPACPSGMSKVVDGGAANRDQCRGSLSNVLPLVGNY